MKQGIIGLIALLSPTLVYALDCTVFPAMFMGKMIVAMVNEPEIKDCQSKAKEEKDACIAAGMQTLADKGNYAAQIGAASDACDKGNLSDVQKWLNTAATNPNIPQQDKDVVTKILSAFNAGAK